MIDPPYIPAFSKFPLTSLLLTPSASHTHLISHSIHLLTQLQLISNQARSKAPVSSTLTARLFFAMQDFPAFSCLTSRYRPRLSLIPLLRLLPGKHLSLLSLTKISASVLLIPVCLCRTDHLVIVPTACSSSDCLPVCQSVNKSLNSLHWFSVFCAAIGSIHHPLHTTGHLD